LRIATLVLIEKIGIISPKKEDCLEDLEDEYIQGARLGHEIGIFLSISFGVAAIYGGIAELDHNEVYQPDDIVGSAEVGCQAKEQGAESNFSLKR